MIRLAFFYVLLFVAILVPFSAGDALAADTVGQVSRTQGQAMAIVGDESRILVQGALVADDETLVTAQDSRLEVKLLDGTVLTLGENAALRIHALVFNKAGKKNQLTLFAEGAFRMITGLVNKATGASVRASTPVGVLSVRGTDLWAGPIDGVYGVFLVEGEVNVRTAGGETTLSEPGSGTNIANVANPPGPVTIWPQDKVDRALAAVAFR